MKYKYLVLLVAGLQMAACSQTPETTTAEEESGPAKVEHLEGPQPTRVTLTEDAAKRLDIQTAMISDTEVSGATRRVIPYAAVLYDTQGDTWTYTNPSPLIFVRNHIRVERIEGDKAVLSEGPAVGVAVVTVGAAELYGSELEFEEE